MSLLLICIDFLLGMQFPPRFFPRPHVCFITLWCLAMVGLFVLNFPMHKFCILIEWLSSICLCRPCSHPQNPLRHHHHGRQHSMASLVGLKNPIRLWLTFCAHKWRPNARAAKWVASNWVTNTPQHTTHNAIQLHRHLSQTVPICFKMHRTPSSVVNQSSEHRRNSYSWADCRVPALDCFSICMQA